MTRDRTPPIRDAVSYAARLADQPRLLLAAKTSLAAVVAWYLAPFIPFAADEYSYYAPLGALVTMSPTVARSTRVGLQVLAGLAPGIGLGLCGAAALSLGVPGGVVLAVIVGVGVLLGGLRPLGAGQDWVALAALFVLLAAGSDRGAFSLSYLVTMAFGVVVGIVVNLLILPPLYLRRAGERLSHLRDAVATLLEDAADAVLRGDVESGRFDDALASLDETGSSVITDVQEADESAQANPRRRRHRNEQDENDRRLTALERTVFLSRELVDLLTEVDQLPEARGADRGDAAEPQEALADAIRRVAAVVATPLGDAAAPARL
ncbi:FUSC family protein, partial [Microbacterium sp. CPCC 204701]|uniref:FUSC family protein n=1 Tax=Microbacterium sp. CPCC 204701 TaxID=2493084 RepID=UPI000FD8C4F5